jgi:hypothetical protein
VKVSPSHGSNLSKDAPWPELPGNLLDSVGILNLFLRLRNWSGQINVGFFGHLNAASAALSRMRDWGGHEQRGPDWQRFHV